METGRQTDQLIEQMERDNSLNMRVQAALHRAGQAVDMMELMTFRESGTTRTQSEVLEVLYHEGPMKVSDVMERTLTTSGNITVVIRNLEKSGLITKEKSNEDKRVFLLTLTDKGRDQIRGMIPGYIRNFTNMLVRMSDAEKEELIRLLQLIGSEDR